MATGDLWQLIDVQTYQAQQVLNVYYFKQLANPSVGTSLAALGTAFVNIYLPVILPLQHDLLRHTDVIITNLDNEDEFVTAPTGFDGEVAGDGMPPFVSWGFRFNRSSRLVRNGAKRIGGVPESLTNNGLPSVAAGILLNTLAALFGTILIEPTTGASFEPRIVHRATDAGPGGDPPATPRADYAVSSVVFTTVTTQNSRKFFHGA